MVKIGRREESVCVLPEARRKKRGMTVGKVRRERRKERKKDRVAFRDRTWSKENGSRVWLRHNVGLTMPVRWRQPNTDRFGETTKVSTT